MRLKVMACGVCGTDLHLLRQTNDYSPLGHEVCARVLETGGEGRHFTPGEQVVIEDVALCGVCDECKSGRVDLCRGGYTMQGQSGMAEELVLHENLLHSAQGLDPVTAAMTEPLAVAIRCVKTLTPFPGSSLLIFGMGAIGLFCAAYARFRGVGCIVMAARERESQRNRAAEPAVYFPLSLQLIRTGIIDVRRAVTHILPLSRAGELKDLYGRDSPAVKTVIVPDQIELEKTAIRRN